MRAPVIRDIRKSDFPQWRRLWWDYLAFYETTLPDTVIETAFANLLDDNNRMHGFMAEIDEEPVGLVHFIFHDHMWRPEGICYLQDLFVQSDTRGHGVGAVLINAVYEAADNAGVTGVYWLTQDFNSTARKLYDQIGVQTPFIRYNRS